MTKQQVMLPTFIVYGVAIVGSIYGGRIPMQLIERGMSVYKARMTTMFIIACFPLLVLLTQFFGNVHRFGSAASRAAVAMMLCRRHCTPGMVLNLPRLFYTFPLQTSPRSPVSAR
jgi:ACS family hexuronate transporter-like MFS transporter